MNKQGIFYPSLENVDSIATLPRIKNVLGCDWFAPRVFGKVQDKAGKWYNRMVNYKDPTTKDDKWLKNFFRDAPANGVKIWLYVDPLGSEPLTEMKLVMERITPYTNSEAFAGVLFVVDDMFNKRTVSAVKLYCATMKAAGIEVNWVNLAVDLRQDLIDAWNLNTNYGLRLVVNWKQCTKDYVSYGIGNRFIPIYPIQDEAEFGFKFNLAGAKEFWNTFMAQDMIALGLWHGKAFNDAEMQRLSVLKWTQVEAVPDPVVPDPVIPDPVIPDPVIPDPVIPAPAVCPVCGTELTCQKCHPIIQVVTVEVPVVPDQPPAEPVATVGFELWADFYQGDETPDFKVLAENGVAGIIAKVGYGFNTSGYRGSVKDKKFRSYIDGALKYNLKTAGYWWNHPTEDWNRQVDTCLDAVRDAPLHFLSVDMEVGRGSIRIQNNKGKWIWRDGVFPNSQISGAGQFMCEALDDLYKVLVYTRTGFILEYSPKMLDWMVKYGLWLAAYLDTHIYTCDKRVAESEGFTYCPTWKSYMDVFASKPDSKLALPRGIASWFMWQFTGDRVKLPGLKSYTDLNWLRITS
ncbi:MAG: hypothetical protein C0391_03960 [Anaerolinea sp.]|nr:hypothetical protein [Anaerolinea sp.]